MTADFMWTVLDHAYPSRLAPAVGADDRRPELTPVVRR
jgi:hypothetical protein